MISTVETGVPRLFITQCAKPLVRMRAQLVFMTSLMFFALAPLLTTATSAAQQLETPSGQAIKKAPQQQPNRQSKQQSKPQAKQLVTLADKKIDDRLITGWLEMAYIANIPRRLRAKLDSGAKTSSIHGTVLDFFEKDGTQWLTFEFDWFERLSKKHQKHSETSSDKTEESQPHKRLPSVYRIQAPIVRQVRIKDHKTLGDVRWVVRLPIFIAGKCQQADFNIADRTRFNYALLLGRDFLQDIALIDSRQTFLTSKFSRRALRNMLEEQPETSTSAPQTKSTIALVKPTASPSKTKTKRKLTRDQIQEALITCNTIGIQTLRDSATTLSPKPASTPTPLMPPSETPTKQKNPDSAAKQHESTAGRHISHNSLAPTRAPNGTAFMTKFNGTWEDNG